MSYNPNEPVSPVNYPPARKSRAGLVAGLVAAVVFVLCAAGVLVAAVSGTDTPPPAAGGGGRVVTVPKLTPPPPAEDPSPAVLTAKDFVPSLKIRSKDCIDLQTMPDTCSYTYEVKLAIADVEAYRAAGDSYAVTYGVKGLDGGEQVDTVEVDGEGQFTGWPGFGQAGPKAKLRVRIIEVEARP